MKSGSLRSPDVVTHVRDLERLRSFFLDALEIGAGMVDAGTTMRDGGDSFAVLHDLGPRLRSLFGYSEYAFLRIDEQDHDFKYYECWPDESRRSLQLEIDHQIERGAFAWALTQTRPVLGRTRDDEQTLVMQVIATRSRIRGMFIGILGQSTAEMRDSMQQVLAMILSNAANAIENHELYDFIRTQNRDLEAIVEERTAALEQARIEAEAANAAKSRFLANMSHEIRTPLTSIIGFSDMLRDAALPETERREAVTTIFDTGRHLLAILNDILDLSRLEADRLKLEIVPCSLFDIVRRVVAVIEPQARGKGLTFRLDYRFPLPPGITTDPTRLIQILFNLCSNSIKFTAQGSIELTVSSDPEHHRVTFCVADSGIGMTAEQQQRLFQAFSQADVSTTRRYGGTGLGLHISQLLAAQLGGAITVQSEAGHGSRFTVEIDAGVIDAAALVDCVPVVETAASTDIPSTRIGGRVLLAEDDPDIRRLIALYLRETDIELVEVDNGKAAVEQALMGDFDLLLTDMQMPEMDGLEAVELLRKAGFGHPVIVMSAGTLSGEHERCLAAGGNDFLSKPLERSRLLALLGKYLGGESGERQWSQEDLAQDPGWQAAREGFIASLTTLRERWRQCCETDDRDGMRAIAHRLKGTAGGFGFDALGECAGRFEAAILAQMMDEADGLRKPMDQEMSEIMEKAG